MALVFFDMDAPNKQLLVRLQLEKARKLLSQANEMYAMEHWDMAANRYYYACFHAVQGLFIHEGLAARRHTGTVRQFSLHFVKTGRIDKRYGSFLSQIMQLREKADYNCFFNVSSQDLKDFASLSEDFIGLIEKMIV